MSNEILIHIKSENYNLSANARYGKIYPDTVFRKICRVVRSNYWKYYMRSYTAPGPDENLFFSGTTQQSHHDRRQCLVLGL